MVLTGIQITLLSMQASFGHSFTKIMHKFVNSIHFYGVIQAVEWQSALILCKAIWKKIAWVIDKHFVLETGGFKLHAKQDLYFNSTLYPIFTWPYILCGDMIYVYTSPYIFDGRWTFGSAIEGTVLDYLFSVLDPISYIH